MSEITAEEFIEKYRSVVELTARREHKDSRIFEVDDLEQEIWIALLPYRRRLDQETEGFVYRAAQVAAQRFAERERNDHMYFAGSFIYTTTLVRSELEIGSWQAEVSDDWDLRMDIQNAYNALTEREQSVLFRRYMQGERFPTDSAEKRIVVRAVEKMANHLNGNLTVELVDLEIAGEFM